MAVTLHRVEPAFIPAKSETVGNRRVCVEDGAEPDVAVTIGLMHVILLIK